MRKLILLLLLLASPAWAGGVMSGVSLSGCSTGGGAAAACSNSTDYAGSKTGLTTNQTYSAGYLDCYFRAATCVSCVSGTWDTSYFEHHGTTSQTATVHIYSTSAVEGSGPQSADALLGSSGTITGNEDSVFESSAISGTVAVTCGTSYWICVMAGAGNWNGHKADGKSTWYKNVSGTPPATMGTGWSESTNSDTGLYVTIK